MLADLLLSSLALCALKPPPSPWFCWFLQKKTRPNTGKVLSCCDPGVGSISGLRFAGKLGFFLLQTFCARKQGSQTNISSLTPFLFFAVQQGSCGFNFCVFWEHAFPTGTLQQHPKAERW